MFDEAGGQWNEPIMAALRPAVFDRQVLTLDVAGFVQSAEERGQKPHIGFGCRTGEIADHRHRLLLRGGNARQRYRAAEQGCEAPMLHSILIWPQPRES